MTIITSQVWPVNENNEIVLEAGTGSGNVVGYVSQDNVAVNTATNKVPVVGVPSYNYDANGNVQGFRGKNNYNVRNFLPKKTSGSTVCDWQANAGSLVLSSSGTGSSVALDTGVQLFGKPTLKCTFSTAASDTFIATYTLTNPIRVKNIKTLNIPILFTSNQTTNGGIGAKATPFQVWIGTSNGKSIRAQCRFENLQSGVFTTISFGRATAYITNHAMSELDAAGVTITNIKIVQETNNTAANSNPVWVGEIRADVSIDKARISIVMDGEYSSQYSVIFPLLKKYNLRASLAVVTSQIGLANTMSLSQMNEMYQYGCEMINHTYEAPPATGATKTGGYGNATQWPTSADIADDIRSQWAFFAQQGWNQGIGYGVWGYTYGFDTSLTPTRQSLVAVGLKSANVQAMRKSVPYAGEENGGVLPPLYYMPQNPLVISGGVQVNSANTLSQLQSIVDQAESTGQWLIITLHRTSDTPSGLETTPSILEGLLSYIRQKEINGSLITGTFSEVFNELYR